MQQKTVPKRPFRAASHPLCGRSLGRRPANAETYSTRELQTLYEARFMTALAEATTRPKNTSLLLQILAFLAKDLAREAERDLAECIGDYRQGYVPLAVPLTLIRHYVRLWDVKCLQDQVYLNPYPKELSINV